MSGDPRPETKWRDFGILFVTLWLAFPFVFYGLMVAEGMTRWVSTGIGVVLGYGAVGWYMMRHRVRPRIVPRGPGLPPP